MIRNIKRSMLAFLMSAFAFTTFTHAVQAAIISTEQVAAANASHQNHEKIAAALGRPEVIAQLEQLGVDKQEVQARVAALTDAEAAKLAGEIDKLPTGGSDWAWAGWLVGILVILLITDFIGWTHIFPWSKHKSKR
jgi:hypothetical protein